MAKNGQNGCWGLENTAGDSKYVVLFKNGSSGGLKCMTMVEDAKMGASG